MSRQDELLEAAGENLIRYTRRFGGPVIAEGKDCLLRDVDGKEYIDFASGQMCATIGHNHPRMVEAIEQSARKIIHLETRILSEEVIDLGKELAGLLPPSLKKCVFLSTGGESVESAIKMAKIYTGKFEIVGLGRGYHGMTAGANSATYTLARRDLSGPAMPGSFTIPAPYCYRCPLGTSYPGCDLKCVEIGFHIVDMESTGYLAALVAEPLLSAGGILEPPEGYFSLIKRKCDERGMVLVFDEAQTGLGRTGSMFAFERLGVVPDILALSKTLGGGVPISATVIGAALEARIVEKGYSHITSHQSDPLPAAVALAVLRVIKEEKLAEKAAHNGEYLKDKLIELSRRHEIIGDVRGRGFLLGVEFVKDRVSKQRATEEAVKINLECAERGLLLPGSQGNVWRVAPPLTITRDLIDRSVDIIDASISAVMGK